MKKVAIAGLGFMGRMHYGCWKKTKGAKVVAICDSDLAQLKHSRKGNQPGMDRSTDFTGIAIYKDFGEMLRAGGFDIVDITLPTPLHIEMVKQALAAGYHVLCEKPMALSVRACDEMLVASQKAKGCFLVAQCLRFWPQYRYLKQLMESGIYGEVKAADFSRLAPPPGWDTGGKSWFRDEKKSGGVVLDLHIHDADMVNYLFGLPETVSSRTHVCADGFTDHLSTMYGFQNMVVTADVSWAMPGTFGFAAGFRIVFEKAAVISDSKATPTLTVYPSVGKPFSPKLSSVSGYEAEIRYFLSLVNGSAKQKPLTARDARDSVALVVAERRSAETKRTVKVK